MRKEIEIRRCGQRERYEWRDGGLLRLGDEEPKVWYSKEAIEATLRMCGLPPYAPITRKEGVYVTGATRSSGSRK